MIERHELIFIFSDMPPATPLADTIKAAMPPPLMHAPALLPASEALSDMPLCAGAADDAMPRHAIASPCLRFTLLLILMPMAAGHVLLTALMFSIASYFIADYFHAGLQLAPPC
jgi:hypothetical protein